MKEISVERLIEELEKYSSIQVGEDVIVMREKNPFIVSIVKDQENIFLSTSMTGNLQLLRFEHIGLIRYNSKSRIWEAVLCDHHILQLKRDTNAEKIVRYYPRLEQINQSVIINLSYLVMIKNDVCQMLSPFDQISGLQISKPFMKRLKEKYPSI